jgi:hypothetical protein
MIPVFAREHNHLGKDYICELTKKRCGFSNILHCCACPTYADRNVVNYVGYKKEPRQQAGDRG